MKKISGRTIMQGCVLAIVACILFFAFFIASISITLKDQEIVCEAPMVTTTSVPYKDIESIELTQDVDYGRKQNGFDNTKFNAGHYYNEQFGDYYLYVYGNTNACIILETTDGIVVINDKDDISTKEMFEKIQSRMK